VELDTSRCEYGGLISVLLHHINKYEQETLMKYADGNICVKVKLPNDERIFEHTVLVCRAGSVEQAESHAMQYVREHHYTFVEAEAKDKSKKIDGAKRIKVDIEKMWC
jgi:hypothetical protein